MQSPAEVAAKKLAWEMESWKSVELQLHTDFENKDPAREPPFPRTFWSTSHYVETAAGQRFFEMRMKPDNVVETAVSIHFTDGSKCALLLRRDVGDVAGQEQVTIKRAFSYEDRGMTYRPEPLKYLYVGLRPLHEVLPQAEYLGSGVRLNRECDRFLFTGVPGKPDEVSLVYWLDRATGMTLRFEHYDDARARAAGTPHYVWNALSLDEVSGHHLALRSELLQYDPKSTDPHRIMLEYKITTKKVQFDQDYPATMFWPSITNQTKVIDMIKNTIVFPKTEGKTLTTAPIRAVDSGGWALPIASAGIAVLGVAALIAGIVLRRRDS
jgi:hypothetical protein